MNKEDPARLAGNFKTRPWTVKVDGLCTSRRPSTSTSILKMAPLEERVYSLRCVEAWSMVIPWIGFPLRHAAQAGGADRPGQVRGIHDAAGPRTVPRPEEGAVQFRLARLALHRGAPARRGAPPADAAHGGLYGQVLPNQNGAPIRVVIPWKYGFKSAKSIVRIRLTDIEPKTAWNKSGAPGVRLLLERQSRRSDHPRWSQATERRIGEFRRRKTLMFNGYGEQVASLYTGMDLKKLY